MSNLKLGQEFCDLWASMDTDKVMARLSKDCVYHNIPMEVMTGHDQIRPFIEGAMTTAKSIEFIVHHIAEGADGAVLTERTDIFDWGGGKTMSIRVMGVFEFKNGLISAWRDYFDLGEMQRQMPG